MKEAPEIISWQYNLIFDFTKKWKCTASWGGRREAWLDDHTSAHSNCGYILYHSTLNTVSLASLNEMVQKKMESKIHIKEGSPTIVWQYKLN